MKLIILSALLLSFSAMAELKIERVWVKNAPPVVPVRAAYLNFVNNSDTIEFITKITSPQFQSIEAHESLLINGVYSMKPLNQLQILPHSSLVLEPKGKHLMLMMPTQSLNNLSHIELNFHMKNEKIIRIQAPIKNSL